MEKTGEKIRGFIYRTLKCRVNIEVVLTILAGLCFTAFAVVHLKDLEEYTIEQFCQLNSIRKTALDVVEENITNWCQSEIVLDSTPDDLEPYLLATLGMQVTVCPCLALTGAVALFGIRQKKARLILPWLIISTIWIVSLVIEMAMLGKWGFHEYALFLLGVFLLAVLSLTDVGYYTWDIGRKGKWNVPPEDGWDSPQKDSFKLNQKPRQLEFESEPEDNGDDGGHGEPSSGAL